MCRNVHGAKSIIIRSALLVLFAGMLSGVLQQAVCGEPVEFECEVFRLVNAERVARGLPEVAWNEQLFDAAHGHAIDMATHETLSHTGSDGSRPSDRISATGYAFRSCGENAAYNYTDPVAVMNGWMASPGHRQNILNESFCELGVGLAYSDADQPYWTQNFARPVSACPAPTGVTPCDDLEEGDAAPDDAAIDDAVSSDGEKEAPTTGDVAPSGDSGGGGCFLGAVGVLPSTPGFSRDDAIGTPYKSNRPRSFVGRGVGR